MDIYTKTLKDAGKADVLVVGSGSAGATAALAAARMGASVILVERYGFMAASARRSWTPSTASTPPAPSLRK